jgi:chemotaxis protein MotB
MGKDAFEDPELRALRASMRPAAGGLRWSRVLTGVLIVACVTFALAYYLPLARAHETLAARFGELNSKIDSANRAADEARAKAKELGDKAQTLEGQLTALQQRETTGGDASRAIKSGLESKLAKPIAAEQAAVGIAGGQGVASISLGYLLARGKLEVSPQGKAALCSVASASSGRALRVVAVVDKKDIPGALAAKLKTPLDYGLAVAGLASKTLLDQCKVAPTKLSATAVPVEPPAPPKLDGKKLNGPRVELWLESAP